MSRRIKRPDEWRHTPRRQTKGEMTRDLIVDFIREYVAREGWAPTVSEIANALDRSTETIRVHLIKLAEQGRIQRGDGPRALRVLPR